MSALFGFALMVGVILLEEPSDIGFLCLGMGIGMILGGGLDWLDRKLERWWDGANER